MVFKGVCLVIVIYCVGFLVYVLIEIVSVIVVFCEGWLELWLVM